MTSPLRNNLLGYSLNQDRLWLLTTPTGEVYAITEYNEELTGYDPRLAEIDPKTFHYSGNAYYITGQYAQERDWKAEPLEDRQ